MTSLRKWWRPRPACQNSLRSVFSRQDRDSADRGSLHLEPLEARLLLATDGFPVPFEALEPAGSLIYRSALQSDISSVDEVDLWTVELDDRQTVALTLEVDTFLRGAVELLGPAGSVLGRAEAFSPESVGSIDPVITPSAGVYTVAVTGLDGTTGAYSVEMVLNAAFEREALGGAENDDPSRAQDLADAFVPLESGAADRGAVVGALIADETTLLGPAVNTVHQERNASVSADGLRLLFGSDRPGGLGGEDIYLATRSTVSEPFGPAVLLGPGVNSDADETAPSLSPDGRTLYFASNRAGGPGGFDIYVATRPTTGAPFGDAVPLGSGVNTERGENNPEISADGLTLYFNTARPDGFGKQDIYAATRSRVTDPFQPAVVLGPEVNSEETDARPALSPDGRTLYFNSRRAGGIGGNDLYAATRPDVNQPFGRAINLGAAVNTVYDERGAASAEGAGLLFFESDRPGGLGESDLYQLRTSDMGDWYRFSLEAGQTASLVAAAGNRAAGTQTLVFQQGRDGYGSTVDTELRQASPDSDLSGLPQINVDSDEPGGTGQDVQGLLRFADLFGNGGGRIGEQDIIVSARIELEVTNPGAPLSVHAMLQDWQASDTWNSFGGNGIQPDGIEASISPVAVAPADQVGAIAFDITPLMLQWQQDHQLNHGVVLLPTGNNGVDFWSAEGRVPPRLIVEWVPSQTDVQMDLFDASGTRWATGIGRDEGLTTAIDSFTPEQSGQFFVRVRGASPNRYNLVITRDADFDREPNDGLAPQAQDIAETGVVLGAITVATAPIDAETEPNDDGIPGGSLADLELANDWSGSFEDLQDGRFRAVLHGEIAAGDDQDWDFFKILASPGDDLEIQQQGVDGGGGSLGDPLLRLLDNTGREIAANDDFDGLDARITYHDFAYQGDYYVVADSFGSTAGSYTLTATLRTDAPIALLDDDYFQFDAADGDRLSVEVAIPGGGSGEFRNPFDPLVALYDPQGNLLAEAEGGALERTVEQAGLHTVRVTDRGSEGGEYVLSIQGPTGARRPFDVTGTRPRDRAFLVDPPSVLTVDLSHGIALPSLDATDLLVDGNPAESMRLIDGDSVEFALPSDLGEGVHEVRLPAGAMVDVRGVPLSGYRGEFTIDATPPRIVASSITEEMVVPAALASFRYTVQFDEPLLAGNLREDLFQLDGERTGRHAATAFDYEATRSELTIDFADLPEDRFTLRLLSGDGKLEDLAGNDLDGDPSFPLPSGDGRAGGDFVVHFVTDVIEAPFGADFGAVAPFGSLVYRAARMGEIGHDGDTDNYTIALDALQSIAVVVEGESSLLPAVQISDSSGTVLGQATPGRRRIALPLPLPSTDAGSFTISVGSVDSTLGTYELRVILNAMLEPESYDGPQNNTMEMAQDIEASFMPLGVGDGQRGAVLGARDHIDAVGEDSPDRADLLYDAETGNLLLDQAEAAGGRMISFRLQSDGQLNAPGVARFPFPGVIVVDTPHVVSQSDPLGEGLPTDVWNLGPLLPTGLSLAEVDALLTTRVYLAATDRRALPLDLLPYDAEPSIPDTADWYHFVLDDGQQVTLALADADRRGVTFELYDSTGDLLALPTTAANADQAIAGYRDVTSDGEPTSYFARVAGRGGSYQLLVTKGAEFDLERNDSVDTAQQLDGGIALGYMFGLPLPRPSVEGDPAFRAERPPAAPAPITDSTEGGKRHDREIPPYREARLIVRFQDDATQASVTKWLAHRDATLMRELPVIRAALIDLHDENVDPRQIARQWSTDPLIRYAEPDYVVQTLDTFPNDPSFERMWGLHNTGQTGGTSGADISAPAAWDSGTGSTDIVIAGIDTGIDYNHVDLAANMWMNPGEIPGDNIDNDLNGYVDDIYGIDTANGDSDPWDDNGHGTHTAGTIGAVGGNGVGVTGVNWSVRLMALKFLGEDGSGSTADAIEAIQYMTRMKTEYGVNVVASNNSWGGGGFSQALQDAIQASIDAGIIFVAAAGNASSNNDLNPFYPASYPLDGIVAVAASDHNDQLSDFSNFGSVQVDIAAPGTAILSTFPGDSYGLNSGTSMASPHVAGAVGLLKAFSPAASVEAIKVALLAGADPIPALAEASLSGGRLNVARSLQLLEDPGDFYRFEAAAGDRLIMETRTPADGPFAFLNTLDPLIELYGPDGRLVAADDNSADDGRNAHLVHTADTSGTYRLRVAAAQGTGEYVVFVAGAQGKPLPLQIVASDPADRAILPAAPDLVTVTLSDLVLQSSLDASDLSVDGSAALEVRAIDGRTLAFTLPPLDEGTHNLTIPRGALRGVRGEVNDLFVSQLTVDATPPRVVFSSLQAGQSVAGDRFTYVAVFDEVLKTAQLDASDIRLTGATFGDVPPVRFEYDAAASRLTVQYDLLPEDAYTLRLVSGDGSWEDLAGNDLDGETPVWPIPPNASGNGVPGSDFVVPFEVDADVRQAVSFSLLAPFGSLLSASRDNPGRLHDALDHDRLQFFTQEGETIAAVAWPADAAATLSIRLLDNDGQWVSGSAGEPVVLPPTPWTATGPASIEIRGDQTTNYRVDLYRNAALEMEIGDSGRGQMLAINDSFVPLGSGRFAVVGESRPLSAEADLVLFGVQPATGDILRIDAASGEVLDRFAAPDHLSATDTRIGLTIGEAGRVLLYVNADRDPTVLWRLNPVTGAVLSRETLSGAPFDGLGFASASDSGAPLLFLSHRGVDVHRQEGYGGPETEDWASGAPIGGLAGDDASRLFGYFDDGQIHEFDPNTDTDESIRAFPAPASDVEGLAFAQDRLYVATVSGRVYTLDPNNGSVMGHFEIDGGGLYGLGAAVPRAGVENVLVNGSFESGDFRGWTASTNGRGELTPWTVGPAGGGYFGSTSPIDGFLSAYNGFDGEAGLQYELYQDVTLPPGGNAHLTTNHRIVFDGLGLPSSADRVFSISVRNPQTGQILQDLHTQQVTLNGAPQTDLGWQQQTFDLSAFDGQSIRVHFAETIPESFTGPANIEFDALALEVDKRGVLAVPDEDLYALDLRGRAGRSIDVILTGLEGAKFPDALLEIVGPDGRTVLARSEEGGLAETAENFDQGILGFRVPEDGLYAVRLRSLRAGTYSLVVTDGLLFDTEPNDRLQDPLRHLENGSGAIGFLGTAGGDVLYGSDRDGSLFMIDLTTGEGTPFATLSSPSTEIEYEPVGGSAFSQLPDGAFSGQPFDLATGQPIGPPVFNGVAFNGLEWIESDLYGAGISGPRGPSQLHILDPLTGTTTLIGATGVGPIAGLAYDRATERLFGIAGGPGPADLMVIDRATGTATVVGSTGIQAGSLEFGPDGLLYAGGTGEDQGKLFQIAKETGTARLVGQTGFGPVTGLMLGPAPAAVPSAGGTPASTYSPASPDGFRLPPLQRLLDEYGFLSGPSSRAPLDVARQFLNDRAADLGLTAEAVDRLVLTDQYVTEKTGVTHLYFRQTIGGIEVLGADLNINVTEDGRVINVSSRVLPGLDPTGGDRLAEPRIDAPTALRALADTMHWDLATQPQVVRTADGPQQATWLSPSGVSLDEIPAALRWLPTPGGGVALAWSLIVRTVDGKHWYDASVDAVSSGMLGAYPETTQEVPHDPETMQYDQVLGRVLNLSDWVAASQYHVFAHPIESPDDGSRTRQVDPHDALASPFGWHDTDGAPGPEFTDTRGNNVIAQEDRAGNGDDLGTRPDGGPSLNFDFPLDLQLQPDGYASAAITNLFYWNNLLHDIHYHYGFDEAAGNFQTNNFDRGGSGGDAVLASTQFAANQGDFDNAFFATPPDGSAPLMGMLLWDFTSPLRDSSLDSRVVVHEYGHGVSTRLTGGPANSNSLNAVQSSGLGEGWSDWWSLMLTQKATDLATDATGVGTYLLGQPIGGAGIRNFPYSFDLAIDPQTYADISSTNAPHGIGEIWASALWDMNWLLINGDGQRIEGHGFDSDVYTGTGGNNLALQLVMDGLKLQPANPSFLDARDAILLADFVATGGENNLAIWTAFARRGMGYSASDGGSPNALAVQEAFDLPASSEGTISFDKEAYEIGDVLTVTLRDSDLALSGSVVVNVLSSGGDAEQLELRELGTARGVFTGRIEIALDTAAPGNGAVDVDYGDRLSVVYIDVDDGSGQSKVVTDLAPIIYVLEPGGDLYQMDLAAGTIATIRLQTPFAHADATPPNNLEPRLVILDRDGFPVRSDILDAGPDQSALRFRAEATGTYAIQILGEGAGAYVLKAETFLPGDMNGDGALDFDDVPLFAGAIEDREQYEQAFGGDADVIGDVNQDGGLDFDDIAPLVGWLNVVAAGGNTPLDQTEAETALRASGLPDAAQRAVLEQWDGVAPPAGDVAAPARRLAGNVAIGRRFDRYEASIAAVAGQGDNPANRPPAWEHVWQAETDWLEVNV